MINYYAQLNLNGIPVRNLAAEGGPTPPSNPVIGQLWTDTSTSPPVVRFWTGAAWVRMDGGDLPDGSVTNTKIANGTIALNKLVVDPTDRANHHGTQPPSSISGLSAYVTGFRLDQFAAPNTAVNLGAQRITNLGTPTEPSDAVTKSWVEMLVDNARAGIRGVKDPVRVAAQENVNLASPGTTIDGVTMEAGDRFLAPRQANAAENGIYVWNGPTSPATRAPDADGVGEIADGTIVAVAEGTDGGKQYIQQATPNGAPGSWEQTWTIYSVGGTAYVAGDGIELSGNVISAKAANPTILVGPTGIEVGNVPVSKGGTGATTAAEARANLGAPGVYTALLPALAAGSWVDVTHNLNNPYPLKPSFIDETTKGYVELEARTVDANKISVKSEVALPANRIRIVIVG